MLLVLVVCFCLPLHDHLLKHQRSLPINTIIGICKYAHCSTSHVTMLLLYHTLPQAPGHTGPREYAVSQ